MIQNIVVKIKTKHWTSQAVVIPKQTENKDAGFLLFGEAGILTHLKDVMSYVIHNYFVLQFLHIAKIESLGYENEKIAELFVWRGTKAVLVIRRGI